MPGKLKEKSMPDTHFQRRPPKGNLFSALLVLMLLTGPPSAPPPVPDAFSRDCLIVAQSKAPLAIGRDERTGDRMITVSPPTPGSKDSTTVIKRDQPTGDQVMHVAPPPEQPQEQDVFIGPLLITPEVTWPDPRKPGKSR